MKSLNKIPAAVNSGSIPYLKKVFILVSLVFAMTSGYAQTPENTNLKAKTDGKVKFVIKPNSREEKVVLRDNNLKRIDKQRKHAVVQKMQQMRQKRMTMQKNDKVRRQEIIQRRKLMMQKRNSLRK